MSRNDISDDGHKLINDLHAEPRSAYGNDQKLARLGFGSCLCDG
jgi:hypothetical protein